MFVVFWMLKYFGLRKNKLLKLCQIDNKILAVVFADLKFD